MACRWPPRLRRCRPVVIPDEAGGQAPQTFLEAFDEATYLATLPGIGWITIAGLIAEIGPFDRYQHGRQLVMGFVKVLGLGDDWNYTPR